MIKSITYKVIMKFKLTRFLYYKYKGCKISIERNNKIEIQGRLLHTKITVKGKNNKIIIEKGSYLQECKINITGNNCFLVISQNSSFKCSDFFMMDNYSTIFFGQNGSVNENCVFVSSEGKKIEVQDGFMISNDVIIRNGDSHSIFGQDGSRINISKDIIVYSNVWIASRAILLKGSIIGANSVIGANSIVSKEYPNNTIISGIPAVVKKENITWSRKRIDKI